MSGGGMEENVVVGLALIIVLGVASQWAAWRLRLPSILLFLFFGFIAGPLTGLIDPDLMFGDLLVPILSLSVSIILFEGGLNLRIADLPAIRRPLAGLILIGAGVTWAIAALSAHYLFGMQPATSVLTGAILVVSGPTVIIPLLRHVRPVGKAAAVLKWEGILIDPMGAMLAVLAFEMISSSGDRSVFWIVAVVLVKTAAVGIALGIAGARLLVEMFRRYLVPDFLQNAVTLLVLVAVATVSNLIQSESGLLAATVMGIAMANQRKADVRHILQFKETLRVLLISGIFVILAARFRINDFTELPALAAIAFMLVLIFIARPLSVWLSTIGAGLKTREKLFLMAVAPRGIVAAAIASVFALRLEENGVADAQMMASVVFMVIVVTVIVYGLSAGVIARRLGVAAKELQGLLFVGAHPLAREIAQALCRSGAKVSLIDTNWSNVTAARMNGLQASFGSALLEDIGDEIDGIGIGRMCALTSNDEVNSLAALHYAHAFGRSEIYQLAPKSEAVGSHMRGRILFSPPATFSDLVEKFEAGAQVKIIGFTEKYDWASFISTMGDRVVSMFVLQENSAVTVITSDSPPALLTGQSLVALVSPERSDV